VSAKFFSDVKVLWLEQILEIRSYWVMYAGLSLLLPLIMVFGFSRFGGDMSDPTVLLRMIGGTMIFAIAQEGFSTMAIRVSGMHRDGMLIYYASLPIRKTALILALVLARAVLLVPPVLVPITIAPLLYPVTIYYHVTLLLLLPLLALLFSTLGVAFGLLVESVEIAQSTTYALLFVLVLAAPVFIPWASLPVPLQIFALALPFTYAADALRMTLTGTIATPFWLDVGVLLAMLIAALFILERRLRWRLE
jgi:ABC-2 type transport system permease protein